MLDSTSTVRQILRSNDLTSRIRFRWRVWAGRTHSLDRLTHWLFEPGSSITTMSSGVRVGDRILFKIGRSGSALMGP